MFLYQNIKILRQVRNLNQSELATLLSVTRDTVASLESQRMKPSFDLLIKLRNFFDINLEDLVFKNLAE